MTDVEKMRTALEEIAKLHTQTILGPTEDEETEYWNGPRSKDVARYNDLSHYAHEVGANKAFSQAAGIAQAALSTD